MEDFPVPENYEDEIDEGGDDGELAPVEEAEPPASGDLTLQLAPDANVTRLDQFLTRYVHGWSRAKLQAAIQAGRVEVDGKVATRPGMLLHGGEAVAVRLPTPVPSTLVPADVPLTILYEDDDLVALDKPAGMMVHPGAGKPEATLVHALLHRYSTLSGAGGAARPGIVHRLDRFTSGVLVAARNDYAHRLLADQFQRRAVRKIYYALVHGRMPAAEGNVDLPIHRDLHHRVRMTTRRRDGREAHTSWRLIEAFEPPADTRATQRSACRYSWLEVRIATGRTHQIRVHMASLGHPVVGDSLYGAPAALAGPGGLAGWKPERLYLHAGELAVRHPRTGATLEFRAPPPQEFAALLERIRSGV